MSVTMLAKKNVLSFVKFRYPDRLQQPPLKLKVSAFCLKALEHSRCLNPLDMPQIRAAGGDLFISQSCLNSQGSL